MCGLHWLQGEGWEGVGKARPVWRKGRGRAASCLAPRCASAPRAPRIATCRICWGQGPLRVRRPQQGTEKPDRCPWLVLADSRLILMWPGFAFPCFFCFYLSEIHSWQNSWISLFFSVVGRGTVETVICIETLSTVCPSYFLAFCLGELKSPSRSSTSSNVTCFSSISLRLSLLEENCNPYRTLQAFLMDTASLNTQLNTSFA